jgi:A/G-specific adenine glycosylase
VVQPPAVTIEQPLLDWAPAGWRDLPWRRTRDPWHVLVSELMLQQTQAERVAPRWEAFIDRWPTPAACASSPPSDVVRAWAGLGYNRRALNVHRAAVAVVERHGGAVPDDLASLLALPGVGAYTARAVLVFAYERDEAVVDTNAARVISRAVAGRSAGRTEIQRLADGLVPRGRGWAWNQAILDLGARVCTARRPACATCPLAMVCRWRAGGGPDPSARLGAAGRSAPFAGSDRQGRGRLLDALRAGPVAVADLAPACGWPDDGDRASRIAAGLVSDGFASFEGPVLALR